MRAADAGGNVLFHKYPRNHPVLPAILRIACRLLALVGVPALSACGGSAAPTPGAVTIAAAETIVSGLDTPWSLAFAPDGRIFVTERPGLIRIVENGRVRPQPFADLRPQVAAEGEGGLLGLALDPAFAETHHLYVYLTYRYGDELRNRVLRLTEHDGAAQDPVGIVDGIPGAAIHDGGRIKFGPDGMLYVTTGDASNQGLAQDQHSLAGKILRLKPDGSIPPDNPFPGSPVYSYGHRNPQGLAWQPGSGALYATEHGPTGDDEVNVIRPGGNYGWPLVRGIAHDDRFIDPVIAFSPAVAPSGAAFYDSARFSCWQNSLFFATLRGTHLHRLALNGPAGGPTSERLLDGAFGRLRDVVVGPDGYLYILTSNRDGRGQPTAEDDRLIRVAARCP